MEEASDFETDSDREGSLGWSPTGGMFVRTRKKATKATNPTTTNPTTTNPTICNNNNKTSTAEQLQEKKLISDLRAENGKLRAENETMKTENKACNIFMFLFCIFMVLVAFLLLFLAASYDKKNIELEAKVKKLTANEQIVEAVESKVAALVDKSAEKMQQKFSELEGKMAEKDRKVKTELDEHAHLAKFIDDGISEYRSSHKNLTLLNRYILDQIKIARYSGSWLILTTNDKWAYITNGDILKFRCIRNTCTYHDEDMFLIIVRY